MGWRRIVVASGIVASTACGTFFDVSDDETPTRGVADDGAQDGEAAPALDDGSPAGFDAPAAPDGGPPACSVREPFSFLYAGTSGTPSWNSDANGWNAATVALLQHSDGGSYAEFRARNSTRFVERVFDQRCIVRSFAVLLHASSELIQGRVLAVDLRAGATKRELAIHLDDLGFAAKVDTTPLGQAWSREPPTFRRVAIELDENRTHVVVDIDHSARPALDLPPGGPWQVTAFRLGILDDELMKLGHVDVDDVVIE